MNKPLALFVSLFLHEHFDSEGPVHFVSEVCVCLNGCVVGFSIETSACEKNV